MEEPISWHRELRILTVIYADQRTVRQTDCSFAPVGHWWVPLTSDQTVQLCLGTLPVFYNRQIHVKEDILVRANACK